MDPASSGKTFAWVLRLTDLCSTAVSIEPFSTLVIDGVV